jgi:RNA polymerase sigma-70 factor (ECF subfamily)
MVRVSTGDKDALSVLFGRYSRTVRGVAFRVLRDPSEADDLLQDIFVLIYRLCRSFDSSKSAARSWILQMTYRRAISRRRYLTARHFYTRVDLDDESELTGELNLLAGKWVDPIERLIGQDVWRRTFGDLSKDQQTTLRLYFFEGYTLAEIAVQLGQTIGNVSHHYYRALEKLRQRMFGDKLQGK